VSQEEKKRVLFRADGNSEIGLGHIYRSLAIAERLSVNFDCYFAIRNPTKGLSKMISDTCTLISIDDFQNKEAEAVALATNVAPGIKADIITLDGYDFDTAYQSAVRQHYKATLISIDDDQPFHYTADIVINHAAGINPAVISREPYTKLCLGYDYLMIRKEFLQNYVLMEHSEINSVLVCFGGADPQDLTGKTVSWLLGEKSVGVLTVIVGAAYEHLQRLKEAVSDDARVDLKVNLTAPEMAGLMRKSHVAIVPASTIALENFSMGLMLICGMTAANQQNIYAGLVKEKSVYGIGDFSNLTCSRLLAVFKETSNRYKEHFSAPKQKNTDGLVNLYNSIK
jgi:UDP-2,4-diacetamido-2,4,6-trideoxy-beta-L-altropyranose hydrolase